MEERRFNILFRRPEYPVIVISEDRLFSAFDIEQLAGACMSSNPVKGREIIQAITSNGEEFWYAPKQNVISPGFVSKKWTKKKIIELFNSSSNAKRLNLEYPLKSLSSKRLERIIIELCEILRS